MLSFRFSHFEHHSAFPLLASHLPRRRWTREFRTSILFARQLNRVGRQLGQPIALLALFATSEGGILQCRSNGQAPRSTSELSAL
jgi:hypothetical protein